MSATNIDIYLSELEMSKQDIKGAIQSKGVTPTGGLSSYAEAILSIPTSSVMGSLEETITENGEYTFNPIDNGVEGYSSVEINVDIEIPTFETQEKIVEIKKNGTQIITPDSGYDGLSSVEVNVSVPTNGSDKTQIPNGFRFTGGDMAAVDFSQYDWSMVYDTTNFFKGCTHSTGDWSNFEQNFNGEVMSGVSMFANSSAPDKYIPTLSLDQTLIMKEVNGVQSLPNIDTSKITNLFCMAFNNANLVDISNLSKWDTSNVKIATGMFAGHNNKNYAPQLNEVDLTNFGHKDGYDARYMFYSSPITKVKGAKPSYAHYMFGYSNIKSVEELDSSNLTSASSMFHNCTSLTSLSPMDCSKITNMNNMFQSCSNLSEINLYNTSNVTDLESTFMYCSITTLPITNFPSATNTKQTFYNTKLVHIPSLSIPLSTTTESMFNYCSTIKTVGDIDIPLVTKTKYMFANNSVLTRAGAFNTPSATDLSNMFTNCPKLLKVAQLDVSSATTLSSLFYTSNSNIIEARFKGNPSKITSYSSMFYSGYSRSGRIYYDGRYDYSKLLSNKPSKWDAVPIPFGEDISTRVRILRENKWFSGEPIKIGNVDAEYKGEGWYEATVPGVEDMKDLKITHNGECLGYSAPGDYYELDVDTYTYEKEHIGQDLANFVVDWGDWYLDGDVLKTDQAGSTMIIEVPGMASFEFDHYSNNTQRPILIQAGDYRTYGMSKYTIYDENDNKLTDISVTGILSNASYSTSQYKKFKITSNGKAVIEYIKCGVFPHFPTN